MNLTILNLHQLSKTSCPRLAKLPIFLATQPRDQQAKNQLKTFLKFPMTIASFLVIAVSLVTSVTHPASTAAQTTSPAAGLGLSKAPFSLAVSPPTTYLAVKPGAALTHTFTLRNYGQQALKITTQITDFTADGTTGKPILGDGSVFDKIINPDLNFGQEFIIEPGENRSLTLSFTISDQAITKEYPLTVLFHGEPIEKNGSSNRNLTAASGTVASNLIIFISDQSTRQGELIIDQIDYPRFIDSFGKINFKILARNLGPHALPITGQAAIKNLFQQSIIEYIFYPDYILGNSSRRVRNVELTAENIDSQGKIIEDHLDKLSDQFSYRSPFMIGPYQIEVQLENQTRQITVIALPFSGLALIFLGLLIFFGYKFLKQKFPS